MTYLEKIKSLVNKKDLEEYYCNQLLNVVACAEKFGVTCHAIKTLLKEYDLKRDSGKAVAKANSISRNKPYEEIKQRITYEILKEYYLDQDHSYEEVTKEFSITGWTLDRLLKDYNLKKDKKISCKRSVQTRYEKAGGKEQYIEQQTIKSNQTKIEKYGSLENFYQIRKETIEKTNLERYGHKYKRTADLITNHNEKYCEVWGSKEKSIEYLQSFEEKPTLEELMQDLNCSIFCINLWCEKFNLASYIKFIKGQEQNRIADFVESLGVTVLRNDRKAIAPKELDIYIPDKKVAIEFNGNYWHSNERGLDKKYHFEKSHDCEQKGIRLIHIYEYQWKDPVKQEILKSIIRNALGKNNNIIYARKCEIRELKRSDVVEFSEINSLHGHRNASIYLGLFYNDELVELMSFGKAFFSKDVTIDCECIRSITKLNTTVVGGMNKLFQYFLKEYQPNKVLYYVDYNTHNGTSMEKLGFDFISYSEYGIINVSNCKEVTEKYGAVFNRKPQKYKEIQEYCEQGKVLTIYDCGVKKYIWTSKQ